MGNACISAGGLSSRLAYQLVLDFVHNHHPRVVSSDAAAVTQHSKHEHLALALAIAQAHSCILAKIL